MISTLCWPKNRSVQMGLWYSIEYMYIHAKQVVEREKSADWSKQFVSLTSLELAKMAPLSNGIGYWTRGVGYLPRMLNKYSVYEAYQSL